MTPSLLVIRTSTGTGIAAAGGGGSPSRGPSAVLGTRAATQLPTLCSKPDGDAFSKPPRWEPPAQPTPSPNHPSWVGSAASELWKASSSIPAGAWPGSGRRFLLQTPTVLPPPPRRHLGRQKIGVFFFFQQKEEEIYIIYFFSFIIFLE